MITQLNKNLLYNSFNVADFDSLEQCINSMAPSLVEYYLASLCEYSEEYYLNKKNIQNSILLGEYSLYIDYNEDIYLEINKTEDEDNQQSFW